MKRRRKGMVLIIAMWAVAIMVVIAIAVSGTVYMTQGQLRAIRAAGRDELASRSAVAAVCTQLLADSQSTTVGNFPLTINEIEVTLVDNAILRESARLNANTVTKEMLAKLNGMDETTAEKFIAAREKLAEMRATEKTDGKANWPIENPLELAKLLSLATSLKYVAKDATPSADAEWYSAAGVSAELAAIMKNLTVYSRQPNTDAHGRARVNINTAATDSLTARLGDVLDEEQIEAIIQSRAESPFANIVELITRDYSPTIDGEIVQISITPETFKKIAGRLTTTDQTVLVGLIDVSAASQDVLRTLPGLSEGDVTSIASWQQFKADSAELAEYGIGGLLDAIPAETLAAIAPYITTRSDLYRCTFMKNSDKALLQYTTCVMEKADADFATIFRYDWSVFASSADNQ